VRAIDGQVFVGMCSPARDDGADVSLVRLASTQRGDQEGGGGIGLDADSSFRTAL
jgi:hypothetical protein